MAKVQEIGPYSAYAIAVKYGYKGTEEEWVKEQEANRKAAEAAAAAAAQSAKDAAASASGVAQSGQQAVQSIKDAQTAAEQAIDTAKQQAVQAAQAEAEKAATSAGQAASSAAEAAQSATNAAAEVGKVQSAGTSAVQAVQQAQNTATGAVADAQQTATQAVSQAQTTAVSAVQAEGTKQTNAVAAAASSALKGISDAKDAALSDVAEAGEAQVSAVGTAGTSAVQGVNDAKTAALKEIADANAALPSPTQSDAGKVPTVKADGSAYELAGPYAPLSAAIRPTAGGNPVSITDSVEWPLQGLKVYGKSTQDGTPSPESPVPIVSAGDDGSIALTVSDGAEQSQSLTISTPAGLPGIPVDSGGNYTDAEGQQWVCDEVDFARGVYVQRLFSISGLNASNYTDDNNRRQVFMELPHQGKNTTGLSNRFVYRDEQLPGLFSVDKISPLIYVRFELGTSLEQINQILQNSIFIYELTTPIETPLSEGEIAAYRALHTYDGSTIVSTAEDVAGIEVKYLADGEKYIDRKISEGIASAAETKLAAYDTLSGAIHEGVNEA